MPTRWLATSASAECAWVVWDGRLSRQGILEWFINGTFFTVKDCTADLLAFASTQKRDGYEVGGEFHCLPDTVDPLGPKGK